MLLPRWPGKWLLLPPNGSTGRSCSSIRRPRRGTSRLARVSLVRTYTFSQCRLIPEHKCPNDQNGLLATPLLPQTTDNVTVVDADGADVAFEEVDAICEADIVPDGR